MNPFDLKTLSVGIIVFAIACLPLAGNSQQRIDNTIKPENTVLVPDQFLRSWDPVTLFFDSAKGTPGQAEHSPEKFVQLNPQHPGAYTWLDEKTLQFRPAEPWPPLTRFHWRIGRQQIHLSTLVSAPTKTNPSNAASDLAPVESVSLTFPAPIDSRVLKKMISIELRPLPGVNTEQAYWLSQDDFEIKALERKNRNDEATYLVNFFKPIAESTHAVVHLRLSLTDQSAQSNNNYPSFYRLSFSTAQAFSVKQMGCPSNLYPISPAGSRYPQTQAIQCSSNNRQLQLQFSSRLGPVNAIEARNLVRISPSVSNIDYQVYGNTLAINADFQTDQLYQVNLQANGIQDHSGRRLSHNNSSELFVFFPPKPAFIQSNIGNALVERFGPKMLPLTGRGHERLDLRIHPIDPLDRSFWPFPSAPITVDEEQRPEAPGEKPEKYTDSKRYISTTELKRQIKALGAPSLSTLVNIPLARSTNSASFGLDLQPHLEKVVGKNKPGSYLIGLRKLGSSKHREWVRLQVSDLSLSTIHEPQRVRFVVTSLSSGDPVSNALVSVEGSDGNIISARTNSRGQYDWLVNTTKRGLVRRIVVSKKDDVLVLDPSQAPERYHNNLWQQDRQTWLQWTQAYLPEHDRDGKDLCHLFTERPIYKPEESVHIKGYIRHHQQGMFSIPAENTSQIHVDGPGDLEWIYPISLSSAGSFYLEFNENNLPTGAYSAWFYNNGRSCGSVSFEKESYRLPTFEVQLNGPARASNDQPFSLNLSAQYYAGGPVANQSLAWRVTQFPYSYTPKKQAGFYYSSDGRFSRSNHVESTTPIQDITSTDDTGTASINIDPTIENTAQARRYVIEATVSGADDQTVTNTFQTLALPPFVLALNIPRYTQDLNNIPVKLFVADSLGDFIAGQSVSIKMLHRQWHSHLQLGDYSQGKAKYLTEVVDSLVYENSLDSTESISELAIPISEAGVYIVQLEARDKLGRSQTVQIDMFAGGDDAVTWSQQASKTFKVTTDKNNYRPGDTATIILESPFQQARALAIVEQANGINRYDWINVRNGTATYKLEVQKQDLPRLPVHFLLIRGRISHPSDLATSAQTMDLGKPQTLASSTFVEVSSADNRIAMALNYPSKVQPGDEISIDIELKDAAGNAIGGEVSLWLVDQSVLALGKEQSIDLMPDFIRHRNSYTSLRDSRNSVLGFFPYQEQPGGGQGQAARAASELLDKVTIRKNFSPVPYFNPHVIVDRSGKQTVTLTLPDNLTNFKVRAKAVSGSDKFGFHKGQISVRLPLVVQPTLPRFVRPGDQFTAIALGRIVEQVENNNAQTSSDDNAGLATIAVDNLTVQSTEQIEFDWQQNKPQRLEFNLQVPRPEYQDDGTLDTEQVSITIAAERTRDKARDAFKIDIPIRPDRKAIQRQSLVTLAPGETFNIEAIDVPLRRGNFHRSFIVSDQTALLHMSAGLNYLLDYPHGCTEQRLSRARAQLASQKFSSLLSQQPNQASTSQENSVRDKVVSDTLQWIDQVLNDNGLVSYWPGSDSYVSLTAWTLLFLTEAKLAGYSVNQDHWDRLVRALRQALRSDYTHFINGESYAEKTWALLALTMAGEDTSAYAAELARLSEFLNLESLSQVILALNQNDNDATEQMNTLYDRMWSQIVFRLYQDQEIYAGLQQQASARNALILPSETRAIAQVLRAVSAAPNLIKQQLPEGRQQNLIDALVNLGQGDGWGSTNANAAALLSLSDLLVQDISPDPFEFSISRNGNRETRIVESHLLTLHQTDNADTTLSNPSGNSKPLSVLSKLHYLPDELGSNISAAANGLVVKREQFKILEGDQAPQRLSFDQAATEIELPIGTVIEEHIEIVVANDSFHLALVVPLAAGMEALNFKLATAPPDAKPQGQDTIQASYQAFYDDQLSYYFDSLPRGTYHFYFRSRANIPGQFTQPPAYAELMYNEAVTGNSHGAKINISKVVE